MGEISCQNCEAACCKGNPLLVMELSPPELAFMEEGGNEFQTIATPTQYDRKKVIYPTGMQINTAKGTFNWLAERGKEHQPLRAGFGRYALIGACKYLETDEDGWEKCGAYERRPEVCRNLVEAGLQCVSVRIRSGVRGL